MQTGNRHTLRKTVIDQFRRNAAETDPKKAGILIPHFEGANVGFTEVKKPGLARLTCFSKAGQMRSPSKQLLYAQVEEHRQA